MNRWLPATIADTGTGFSERLVPMLEEHSSHRTERRGCGFTQSTRFLATFVNAEASCTSTADLGLFERMPLSRIDVAAAHWQATGRSDGWRRMDLDAESSAITLFRDEARQLTDLRAGLVRESAAADSFGSRTLIELVRSIVDRAPSMAPKLPPMRSKPEVGSCSQAEEFFLEIAHGKVRRGGSVNVIVDARGEPLALEKMNLGESHSALALVPLVLNAVTLPPGSLFALRHADSAAAAAVTQSGRCLSLADIAEAWFLRLTTLAAPPEVRLATFSAQVETQLRGNMVSPLTTTLEHVLEFARRSLRRAA